MVFSPWVDNDVSMHKVVGLVVLIPTSPRSSKSESGRKRYHCFCKHVFLLAWLLVDRPPHRPTRHHARQRRLAHRLARHRPALVLVATGQFQKVPGPRPASRPVSAGLARRHARRAGSPTRLPRATPGVPALPPGCPKTLRFAPNSHISFGYKRGFFPNSFLWF